MTEIERKRAYLEKIWYIEEELSNIDLEAKHITADARGISAMEYSDMPSAHKITDLSDKMVMLERRMNELRKGKALLIDEKYKIINAINSIQNPTYKRVLWEKYINNKKNDEIGSQLGYGDVNIKKIVRKAIDDIIV